MSSPEAALQDARPASAEVKSCIGVINAGSSSIKFGIYQPGEDEPVVCRGRLEGLGTSPRMRVADAEGTVLVERSWSAEVLDARAATREVLATAAELARGRTLGGIGHRVAHGGARYGQPIRIDAEVLSELRKLCPLAPLHQPHNLAPIDAIAEAAPHLPQVACFDTAFHRGQPPVAQALGLPRRFAEDGLRRYGFHGLSYEYICGRLPEIAPRLAQGRVIIAHLGNGASLCAVDRCRSVATTMGFSSLDGLIMGTRCGAMDPGVLLFLMDGYGMGARELEDLMYRRSGLLGVSGVSSDMRALRASGKPEAAEAIELFVYRAVRETGSLAAALGGLDGLVFTGGIGENDAETRAEIAAGCVWLGLELDPARNAGGAGRISADGSKVEAWVTPTDEERMIARHAGEVLGLGSV